MKLNKLSVLLAAVLALGSLSAHADYNTADITVTGTSVGTCTPTATSHDLGVANFAGTTYYLNVNLGITCSDAGVAWSLTTPVESYSYTINGTNSGSVRLANSTTGTSAFTTPIAGTGTNAAIPAQLVFSAPGGPNHLGVLAATVTLRANY